MAMDGLVIHHQGGPWRMANRKRWPERTGAGPDFPSHVSMCTPQKSPIIVDDIPEHDLHIPYNCWWYQWYPRKYISIYIYMNLCLLRLLQSPFFLFIKMSPKPMFDEGNPPARQSFCELYWVDTTSFILVNTQKRPTHGFPSGPPQVSSEHTHWGHGGGGGGRWNQCGNWNLSGPPWCRASVS